MRSAFIAALFFLLALSGFSLAAPPIVRMIDRTADRYMYLLRLPSRTLAKIFHISKARPHHAKLKDHRANQTKKSATRRGPRRTVKVPVYLF